MTLLQRIKLSELSRINTAYFTQHKLGAELSVNSEDAIALNQTVSSASDYLLKKNIPVKVLHSPFVSLSLATEDRMVSTYSLGLLIQAISIAAELGIKKIVFHAGLEPNSVPYELNRFYPRFCQNYSKAYAKAEQHNIVLMIENTYEREDIRFFESVFADFPQTKMTLDIGHIHCFSQKTFFEWNRMFFKHIDHYHLHNNNLMEDQHLALSDGKIDYPAIIPELKASATLTLETSLDELDLNRKYLLSLFRSDK